MKNYLYTAGAVAVAVALSGLPALAFADGSGDVQVGATATMQVQGAGTVDVSGEGSGSVTVNKPSVTGSSENSSETSATRTSEGESATTSSGETEAGQHTTAQAQAGMQQAVEHAQETEAEGLPFKLESTTTAVFSAAQLQKSIQNREQELNQEMEHASSSVKAIMQNANPVRLAVHSLLASKDLLGGIGQQVSQIAQQMNASVASTTQAETQIQSRGFWTRFLFGGDTSAANALDQQVSQNQQRIQDLTQLLNQANVSVQVKTTLQAQITALQQAQTRLQTLAQQEKGAWGLFSWRF